MLNDEEFIAANLIQRRDRAGSYIGNPPSVKHQKSMALFKKVLASDELKQLIACHRSGYAKNKREHIVRDYNITILAKCENYWDQVEKWDSQHRDGLGILLYESDKGWNIRGFDHKMELCDLMLRSAMMAGRESAQSILQLVSGLKTNNPDNETNKKLTELAADVLGFLNPVAIFSYSWPNKEHFPDYYSSDQHTQAVVFQIEELLDLVGITPIVDHTSIRTGDFLPKYIDLYGSYCSKKVDIVIPVYTPSYKQKSELRTLKCDEPVFQVKNEVDRIKTRFFLNDHTQSRILGLLMAGERGTSIPDVFLNSIARNFVTGDFFDSVFKLIANIYDFDFELTHYKKIRGEFHQMIKSLDETPYVQPSPLSNSSPILAANQPSTQNQPLKATKENTVTVYFYTSTVQFSHVIIKTYGATEHFKGGTTIDVHPRHLHDGLGRLFTVLKTDDKGEPDAVFTLHGVDVCKLENTYHEIYDQAQNWNLLTNNSASICHLLLTTAGFYDTYNTVAMEPSFQSAINDAAKQLNTKVKLAAAIVLMRSVSMHPLTILASMALITNTDSLHQLPQNIDWWVNRLVVTPSNLLQKVQQAHHQQSQEHVIIDQNNDFAPSVLPGENAGSCILC